MRFILAIIAVSFLSNSVVAQVDENDEVLYCTDKATSGFKFDKLAKEFKISSFKPARYVVNLNLRQQSLQMKDFELDVTSDLECKIIRANVLSCTDGSYTFLYNYVYKKYTYTQQFGNIFENNVIVGDDLSVSYGTCTKF